MVHIVQKFLVVLGVVILSETCVGAISGNPQDTQATAVNAKLGIAFTPRNFPARSAVDVKAAFETAAGISRWIVRPLRPLIKRYGLYSI